MEIRAEFLTSNADIVGIKYTHSGTHFTLVATVNRKINLLFYVPQKKKFTVNILVLFLKVCGLFHTHYINICVHRYA